MLRISLLKRGAVPLSYQAAAPDKMVFVRYYRIADRRSDQHVPSRWRRDTARDAPAAAVVVPVGERRPE